MDRDGIDVAVTLGMGWKVHDFAVEANDYILESAKGFPRGTAWSPFAPSTPAHGDVAVAESRRGVQTSGPEASENSTHMPRATGWMTNGS